MATPSPQDGGVADTVATICAEHGNRPDALIEILHGVQAEFGHVPESAVEPLASALNLTRADVHGVISFYHDFERTRPGRHVLKLCRAESCQANGSNQLADHAKEALGVPFGGTTADGAITLKAVYCLGNCALGPSLLVGENLHARVDAAKFDALVADLRESGE
ncbi:MAG: formate dehydrogenase subunit gamma [Alphaproteobacteria bacterium]|nr:formate dehydrogenase subunit gamma [Alphaproteobacteria bacterium]